MQLSEFQVKLATNDILNDFNDREPDMRCYENRYSLHTRQNLLKKRYEDWFDYGRRQ